ncbi:MAG: polysaccharide deacetylase family protein [Clostridia bacterium]
MLNKKLCTKDYIIYVLLFIVILTLSIFLYFIYKNNKSIEIQNTKILSQVLENESKREAIINELDKIVAIAVDKKVQESKRTPKNVNAAIPIFMYHFVSEDPGENPYPENVVRVSTLEEQLKYLQQEKYETIFISDFDKVYTYAKPVVLTFDDGFLDVYKNAYPLLKKYNLKATIFVVADFTKKHGYCNIDQLKEMLDSGLVKIESHTITHRRLATLKDLDLNNELKNSKQFLTDNVGVESTVLCYPYGSFNNKVANAAKEWYKYGLAMDGGVYYTQKSKDLLKIPRIYVNRSMTLQEYRKYCSKSTVAVEW